MKNLQLVQICADGEARASTEALADGFNVSHKAVLQLLRRYRAEIETLGQVAFESRTGYQSSVITFAMLNERQSRFLVSLMRNTKRAVEFNLRLVHEFWRIARALENRDRTMLQRRLKLEAQGSLWRQWRRWFQIKFQTRKVDIHGT